MTTSNVEIGIGIGPTLFSSLDENSTSFLDENATVESTSSMLSSYQMLLLPLPTEPITTRFQQYLFNFQPQTPPKASFNDNTRYSISDDLYFLNRCFSDHYETTTTLPTASTDILDNIDATSSSSFDTSMLFMTTQSFSTVSEDVQMSANELYISETPSSHINFFPDCDNMTSKLNCPMDSATCSVTLASTEKPTFTSSTIVKHPVSSSSLFPSRSTSVIDNISPAHTVVSDISMVTPMSDASLISDSCTRIASSSSSQGIFGLSSCCTSMAISSTESSIASPIIHPLPICADPSKMTTTSITLPLISPESQQAVIIMAELFMNHISNKGSESNRISMSGLIKNAIPVRGVKMLRIRYELHSWWNDYKRHNAMAALDVQKAFAFKLLASEWFEDKLAAVVFMQEVLLANQNFGLVDLESFEAAFAKGHVNVYKVCDHLSDKVLSHIVHHTSKLTEERKQTIEKLFEWTRASDMWQSRAAISTLTHFVDDESLRNRILKATMVIMRRPENEAKSAAGAALRELSKFEMNKVLGVLSEPDNIAATSVIALTKACANLTANVVKELKRWRKNVIAQRRSR